MPSIKTRRRAPLPLPPPARSPPLPAAAADVVSPPRPRSAVAQDRRPVPHPRVGDHAAADAGRSRAAEVRRVAGEVPVARRAGRRAGAGGDADLVSARLQHPAHAGCRRSRANRSRATAASCRPTRRRCCRSRASAPTPPARSAASPSASAPPFSTPTSPACCFGSSSAKGDPKSHAMKRHLWSVSETLVPMRHVFDFNQALMDFGAMVCVARNPRCLVCPMAKSCRRPFTPTVTTIVVTAAVIERDGRVPGHATPAGRPSRGLLGVSRRQVRPGRIARPRVWRASCAKSSTSTRASATSSSRPRTRMRIAGRAAFLRVRAARRADAAARSGDAMGRREELRRPSSSRPPTPS